MLPVSDKQASKQASDQAREEGRTHYLSITQAVHLSSSHWSGQGTHTSLLANLKQLLLGEEVWRRVSQTKQKQNGVTKVSFDRKDIC